MNESEPNTNKTDETSKDAAEGNPEGDFTLTELQQAYYSNFDHLGRLVERRDVDE